jgi:signal transduction histidine kinase
MEYGMVKGICWYRIFSALMSVFIVFSSKDKLTSQSFGLSIAFALLIISLIFQAISREKPMLLLQKEVILAELLGSMFLIILGVYIYKPNTSAVTFAFASQYVLASVLMASIAFGLIGGLISGVIISATRLVSSFLNGSIKEVGSSLPAILSTSFTYIAAGAFIGFVIDILKKSGGELSEIRAKDNIARTLHDGVLQTLIIIKRKSKEDSIVELATRQEVELREFLFQHDSKSTKSEISIRTMIDEVVKTFNKKIDIPISLVVSPDIGTLTRVSQKALLGAISECLNNIDKHADATSVRIFIEPIDNMCTVSIIDDGIGFDVDYVMENSDGHGLNKSIVARIEEIGGTVEFRSSPNVGTEVTISIPQNPIDRTKLKQSKV